MKKKYIIISVIIAIIVIASILIIVKLNSNTKNSQGYDYLGLQIEYNDNNSLLHIPLYEKQKEVTKKVTIENKSKEQKQYDIVWSSISNYSNEKAIYMVEYKTNKKTKVNNIDSKELGNLKFDEVIYHDVTIEPGEKQTYKITIKSLDNADLVGNLDAAIAIKVLNETKNAD